VRSAPFSVISFVNLASISSSRLAPKRTKSLAAASKAEKRRKY
jgi:hypothetical protein